MPKKLIALLLTFTIELSELVASEKSLGSRGEKDPTSECPQVDSWMLPLGGGLVASGLGFLVLGVIGSSTGENQTASALAVGGALAMLTGTGFVATSLIQESRLHSCFSKKSNGRIHPDASAMLRKNRSFALHVTPFGGTHIPGSFPGISAAGFISPNTLLEANYLSGYGFEGGEYETNTQLVLTRIRILQFIGNSFYVGGGLAHRRAKISMKNFKEDREVYSLAFKDSGLEALVGNRWQWRSLSLGFDWYGIYFPLLKHSKNLQDEQISNIEEKYKTKAKRYSNYANYGTDVLRFYIGLSF